MATRRVSDWSPVSLLTLYSTKKYFSTILTFIHLQLQCFRIFHYPVPLSLSGHQSCHVTDENGFWGFSSGDFSHEKCKNFSVSSNEHRSRSFKDCWQVIYMDLDCLSAGIILLRDERGHLFHRSKSMLIKDYPARFPRLKDIHEGSREKTRWRLIKWDGFRSKSEILNSPWRPISHN